MEINHIASGSKGNAILVGDGYSRLLLDCGLSYKDIARHVMPSSLAGVLLTHEHMDHAKAAEELLRRGTKVYMSLKTANALGFGGAAMDGLRVGHLQQFRANSWMVLPFNVEHDAEEPMGYLFQSRQTGEKGVYIVDSGYVQYNFKEVTHWLIECNYSEPLLEAGPYEDYLKDRVRKNHFSLEDLKTFLKDSDLSKTEEIYLLHMSNANADEEGFREEIQKMTGVPVYTISDSKQPKSIAK